eukprot:SAG31_NODE_485_length_15021_cov_9.439791_17_plen_104_part_00
MTGGERIGKDCLLSRFCGTFRAESPTYAPRNRLLLSRFYGTFRAESPVKAPRNLGLIQKVSPCRSIGAAANAGGANENLVWQLLGVAAGGESTALHVCQRVVT